ncbi:hypothetical protein QN277_014849 [Acacia crassicarpa]|uniref:Uncharacterized protein n=1 Tax=Acacia crassicarpa TaxID=499986 RepID=A0AAE1JTU9_9FABA|nr:hypothetical protein QN277_014849 [Acacia crassicarpa]
MKNSTTITSPFTASLLSSVGEQKSSGDTKKAKGALWATESDKVSAEVEFKITITSLLHRHQTSPYPPPPPSSPLSTFTKTTTPVFPCSAQNPYWQDSWVLSSEFKL